MGLAVRSRDHWKPVAIGAAAFEDGGELAGNGERERLAGLGVLNAQYPRRHVHMRPFQAEHLGLAHAGIEAETEGVAGDRFGPYRGQSVDSAIISLDSEYVSRNTSQRRDVNTAIQICTDAPPRDARSKRLAIVSASGARSPIRNFRGARRILDIDPDCG